MARCPGWSPGHDKTPIFLTISIYLFEKVRVHTRERRSRVPTEQGAERGLDPTVLRSWPELKADA